MVAGALLTAPAQLQVVHKLLLLEAVDLPVRPADGTA